MITTLQDLDHQVSADYEMVMYKRGFPPLFRWRSVDRPWDRIVYSVISQGTYSQLAVDPQFEIECAIEIREFTLFWLMEDINQRRDGR